MSRVPQYDLLPDWDKYLLGDICKLRSENYEPKKNGTLKYIGLKHIESGIPIITNFGFETDVKSTKHRFYPNDILYGKLRPYLDKVALSNIDGISSTDILILKAEQTKVLQKYLIKLLHHNRFLKYATSTMTGTTLPRTNWKTLSKFVIFLPKIVEQKKIVPILENGDKLIQTTQQLIEKLQECKKGLMQRLFTMSIDNSEQRKVKFIKSVPKHWKKVKFYKIALIDYGIQASVASNNNPEIGVPILTNKNITLEGKTDITELNYYALKNEDRNKYILSKGDILFNWRSGSKIHIGKTTIFNLDGNFTFSSFILRIRPLNENFVRKLFIYYFLSYLRIGQKFFQKNLKFMINATFNKSQMEKLNFYFPEINEQDKIITILENIDKLINNEEDYLDYIKRIKMGLMQVLLTGKKRVPV